MGPKGRKGNMRSIRGRSVPLGTRSAGHHGSVDDSFCRLILQHGEKVRARSRHGVDVALLSPEAGLLIVGASYRVESACSVVDRTRGIPRLPLPIISSADPCVPSLDQSCCGAAIQIALLHVHLSSRMDVNVSSRDTMPRSFATTLADLFDGSSSSTRGSGAPSFEGNTSTARKKQPL